MKSLVAAVIILSVISAGTLVASLLLARSLHSIEEEIISISIDTDSFEEIARKADSAKESYEKAKLLLNLLLDDKDEQAISDYIMDIRSSAEARSKEGVEIGKNRLVSETKKTRRLFTISIDSIF